MCVCVRERDKKKKKGKKRKKTVERTDESVGREGAAAVVRSVGGQPRGGKELEGRGHVFLRLVFLRGRCDESGGVDPFFFFEITHVRSQNGEG